jgi:hypothetical protein
VPDAGYRGEVRGEAQMRGRGVGWREQRNRTAERRRVLNTRHTELYNCRDSRWSPRIWCRRLVQLPSVQLNSGSDFKLEFNGLFHFPLSVRALSSSKGSGRVVPSGVSLSSESRWTLAPRLSIRSRPESDFPKKSLDNS